MPRRRGTGRSAVNRGRDRPQDSVGECQFFLSFFFIPSILMVTLRGLFFFNNKKREE